MVYTAVGRGPVPRCLLLTLIFLAVPLPASAFQSTAPPPDHRMVAGVYVDEKAGALSDAEAKLLRRLDETMLPLPDTIRIRVDSVHFGVYAPLDGEMIYLSHDRFRAPDSLSRTGPYLFGRANATSVRQDAPSPRRTHTLAHELGHFISPRLSAPHPRPAWGTARTLRRARWAREIEAELIAAVLQQVAFGIRPSALGYPQSVKVYGTGTRSTQSLLQEYRGIIGDTWRLSDIGL
ncbi:MAG: hypothetical protein ABEL51_02355 [Salinibacter sp.]